MKLKPKNPGSDQCIMARCRAASTIIMGRGTLLEDEDAGLCDTHHAKHCDAMTVAYLKTHAIEVVNKEHPSQEQVERFADEWQKVSRKKRAPVPRRA